MDVIEQLGVALGLASLAGLNLYLTVLVTGLAMRLDLLELADRFHALAALEHPMVLATSGTLFLLEFFADKVPWVDSLWDSIHTIIRPTGAVLIAIPALGQVDPALQVVGALLAGGVAATTHATKASTRLLINTSPEPVSNTAASVAEDTVVLAGLGVIAYSPLLALIMVALLLLCALFLLPRTWRAARTIRGGIRQAADKLFSQGPASGQ